MPWGMQKTLQRPKAEASVQARHTGGREGRRGSMDTGGPEKQPEPTPHWLGALTQDQGSGEVSMGSGQCGYCCGWVSLLLLREERNRDQREHLLMEGRAEVPRRPSALATAPLLQVLAGTPSLS